MCGRNYEKGFVPTAHLKSSLVWLLGLLIGDDREGGGAVFLREAAGQPRGPADGDPQGQAGRQKDERHQHPVSQPHEAAAAQAQQEVSYSVII